VTGASAQVSGEMYLGGDPGLMTTSSYSHARGAGTGARTKDEAAVLAASGHLTDRDRDLVRLVAVHRVLATSQLAALGFGNITTARHRLSALVRLGLLRRFRPHPPTGSAPWHYVLGPVGAAMLGVEDREEKRWLPHVRADRQLSLERSPRLTHMTGRNWFFVALAQDAREHAGELREWLNEADTAARYENAAIRQDDRARLPHPDGAGTWAEDGRAV
jgi:Replication-relaxation